MDAVTRLQQLLLSLSALTKQADGCARSLAVLVRRGPPSNSLAQHADQLERQAATLSALLDRATAEDAEFLALTASLLGPSASSGGAGTSAGAGSSNGTAASLFKVKKLKSDYERKLSVRKSLQDGRSVLKRCNLAALELRKRVARQQASDQRSGDGPNGANPFSTGVAVTGAGARAGAGAGLGGLGTGPTSLTAGAALAPAPSPAAPPNARYEQVQQQQQQQQYALREFDEAQTQALEQAQLRSIARDSALVQEMSTKVASILEEQGDDVQALETNTEDSVAKTIEGVHELSRARLRQAGGGATKATLGSATVGTLVGIVGGPVGMVIGAGVGGFVGNLAGRGVAAVKRRSINAETRKIKALLALRQQQQQQGEFTLHVYAYETQQWSILKRRWLDGREQRLWTDEFGAALPAASAHPDNEVSALEARVQLLVRAREDGAPEEEAEIAAMHKRELMQGVVWRWSRAKWDVANDRPGADIGGWDYAASATADADRWLAQPARTSVVRRRLWLRYLEGRRDADAEAAASGELGGREREKARYEERRAARLAEAEADIAAGASSHDREAKALWHDIVDSSAATSAIMTESLAKVTQQGDQIGSAERNATIVGDAALFTDRIERAGHLSGAIRNMVSVPTGGKLRQADGYSRELERRQQLAREQADKEKRQRVAEQQQKEENELEKEIKGDAADEAASTLAENLRVAKLMASSLDTQNLQLDRTAAAVDRGNRAILKTTKRIK